MTAEINKNWLNKITIDLTIWKRINPRKQNRRWCPVLHAASQLNMKASSESIIVPRHFKYCTHSTAWKVTFNGRDLLCVVSLYGSLSLVFEPRRRRSGKLPRGQWPVHVTTVLYDLHKACWHVWQDGMKEAIREKKMPCWVLAKSPQEQFFNHRATTAPRRFIVHDDKDPKQQWIWSVPWMWDKAFDFRR